MPSDKDVTFRVKFEPVRFDEDLRRAGAAGRALAIQARGQLERDGIAAALLSPCHSEHRDGTQLEGLVKLYVPIPSGPDWGFVLEGARDSQGLHLLVVAFGQRHPERRPSVYDLAHYQRHGAWPPTMPRP